MLIGAKLCISAASGPATCFKPLSALLTCPNLSVRCQPLTKLQPKTIKQGLWAKAPFEFFRRAIPKYPSVHGDGRARFTMILRKTWTFPVASA